MYALIVQGGPLDKMADIMFLSRGLHFPEKRKNLIPWNAIFQLPPRPSIRQRKRRGIAERDKTDGWHVKWIFYSTVTVSWRGGLWCDTQLRGGPKAIDWHMTHGKSDKSVTEWNNMCLTLSAMNFTWTHCCSAVFIGLVGWGMGYGCGAGSYWILIGCDPFLLYAEHDWYSNWFVIDNEESTGSLMKNSWYSKLWSN